MDSLGYVVKGPARRHLERDRLALLRVPDGPIRKELVKGRRVTLPDGRIIDPTDVLGPLESGSKLVVIGDAGTTDGLDAVVADADLLVIEATFLQQDAAIARSYGHLTVAQAASLAAASNVKRLILTHISGRYSAEAILAEAKAIFTPVQIANDLERTQSGTSRL
jgi:ribonuclease Z